MLDSRNIDLRTLEQMKKVLLNRRAMEEEDSEFNYQEQVDKILSQNREKDEYALIMEEQPKIEEEKAFMKQNELRSNACIVTFALCFSSLAYGISLGTSFYCKFLIQYLLILIHVNRQHVALITQDFS